MPNHQMYIAHTQKWIADVVIEYNLCPFARTPAQQQTIRYIVSDATKPKQLLNDLVQEIELLKSTAVESIETTVLIHPFVLKNFFDYNDFLQDVDDLLEQNGFIDDFQVASLHPHYQFAGTDYDDVENYTNRSPYPILHLLRAESVSRALENYAQPERIPERNIRLMKKYGIEHMQKMLAQCTEEE